MAGAVWAPAASKYRSSAHMEELAQNSLNKYKEWMNKFNGISKTLGYLEVSEERFEQMMPLSLGVKRKLVKVYFSPCSQRYKELIQYESIRINTPIFLP